MIAMRIVRNATREDRRLSGISMFSGQQYAASAVAKVDPHFGFTFLSIALPGHLPCRSTLKWRSVNVALVDGPGEKKAQKRACVISYDSDIV
jgi:hypothetical protein